MTRQTHITTLLPRLRFLEELILSNSPSTDAFLEAVSEHLRTATCLRSLAVQHVLQRPATEGVYGRTGRELDTEDVRAVGELWCAAMPPGTLGKYVTSEPIAHEVGAYRRQRRSPRVLLLEQCLVRNSTLSTLQICSVCGGESTARFLTKILAECPGLKKLALGKVRDVIINISDATLTRCADALAANETLEELTLPHTLWHSKNWITFLDFLPRNKHLRSLEISSSGTINHVRTSDIIEVLACVRSLPRAHFNVALGGHVLSVIHFRDFFKNEAFWRRERAASRSPTTACFGSFHRPLDRCTQRRPAFVLSLGELHPGHHRASATDPDRDKPVPRGEHSPPCRPGPF
ncbi:hypothetical protein MTO96_030688 [Rhipicephalus appendiculatus]